MCRSTLSTLYTVSVDPDEIQVHFHRPVTFKVVAILSKPWKEPPFGLGDDSGVHRMPKLTSEAIANFKFIYPKNSRELLFYIAALGGLKADNSSAEIPDLILIENVEQFFESASSMTTMILRRILTSLVYLCDVISNHKPIDIVITSARLETWTEDVGDIGQYLYWLDEIWETSETYDDVGVSGSNMTLTSVDGKLPFHYRLNFKFLEKPNMIFVKSLIAESDDEPSSPVF